MGTTIDISYWGLGIGMLLLLIPLYFFHRFKTGLVKATIVGAIRMVVQLFLIGIYLKYLFLWDNPWINFLWVFIMVFVATETALSRTRLKRNILMIPIVVGFLASAILPRFLYVKAMFISTT